MMMRIRMSVVAVAIVAALAGCSDSTDESLERSASARAKQLEESPDAPARPLTEEESEADLSELMDDQDKAELIFDTTMIELFWGENVTDADRVEACATPDTADDIDPVVDEFMQVFADQGLDVDRDAFRAYAEQWGEEQCELVNEMDATD